MAIRSLSLLQRTSSELIFWSVAVVLSLLLTYCELTPPPARLPSPPNVRRMLTLPDQISRPSVPLGFLMPNVMNTTTPNRFARTPTRVGAEDFDSQIVDTAMNNLPTVLSQVFNIQKGQTNDIHELQQLVTDTKAKIAVMEEKKGDIRQEITSMTRKLYLAEEDIKETGKTCKVLKSDIENLVVSLYERQRDIIFKEEDVDKEIRKLQDHKAKKAKFADEVAEYETKTSEIQKKMNDVNTKLQALRQQKTVLEKDKPERDRIVKGVMAKDLQSDSKSLKQKLDATGLQTKAKEEQLSQEKEKQHQINQTMQVLQKRNAAQLTRLRRQLKDVHLQNKQWTNQITNLELKINQLRSEVDVY